MQPRSLQGNAELKVFYQFKLGWSLGKCLILHTIRIRSRKHFNLNGKNHSIGKPEGRSGQNYFGHEPVGDKLAELVREGQNVDMMLCNYIYDKQGVKHKKVIRYANVFPQDQVFTWKDAKHFHLGQYILMHSVIYRTQMLKNCGLELPQHTFYVDNIFVYYPLPYVKNLYYMDLDLYHYFIGRSDQSVNEQVMIGRVDQQIKVNKIMIDQYDLRTIQNPKLRKYMTSYLDIMMTVSSIMLIRSGTQESLDKKKDLWQYLKKKDAGLYYKLYFGIFGRAMNIPGKGGRKVSVFAYKLANKVMGFN